MSRALVVLAAAFLMSATAQAQTVLVFDDNSNDHVAATACTNLGYACTVAGEANFTSLLSGGTWALVVMDMPSNRPAGAWPSALAAYVNDGGRAILTGWEASDFTTLAPLFGVTLGASHDALNVHRWSTHPLFAAPNVVPDTMTVAGDDWGSNGFYLTVDAGASAAAGFVAAPAAGQAGIVIANGGRSIFNGFLFDDYFPANADADGKDDVVELVENEMSLALAGYVAPVPPIPALGSVGLSAFALVVAGLGAAIAGRRLLA